MPVITEDPIAPYYPYLVAVFSLVIVLLLGLIVLFRKKNWITQIKNTGHINIILDIWIAVILILITAPSALYSPIWSSDPPEGITEILWATVHPIRLYIGIIVILLYAWKALSKALNMSLRETICHGVIIVIVINYSIYLLCAGDFPSPLIVASLIGLWVVLLIYLSKS
jgi:hypothetical protein